MGNKSFQVENPYQDLKNYGDEFEILNGPQIKEKDNISKGTYKDQYKVEKKDLKDFYDYIIDIKTFSQKPNIKWAIETKTEFKNIPMPEKDKKIEVNNNIKNENIKEINENNIEKIQLDEKKDDIDIDIDQEQKAKTVIGILGLGNVGKSYLLSLFTDEELPTGNSIHTKGISIKNVNNFVILDSEGIDAALTKKNISKEIYPMENLLYKSINDSDSLIEQIARDKKAVELFIQDFIIKYSDILVIVVGQLTLTEQKLINRVVKVANKHVYVIHNLKNLYSKEQILEYIENTFKKNIFFHQGQKFTEQIYKGKKELKNKEDEFDKYYLEIYDDSRKVMHYIMGSNVEESKTYCFNKTLIDNFRTEISSYNNSKKFNIFNQLKQFLVDNGSNYIESSEANLKPFNNDDITKIKEGEKQYICIRNENNRIKKCIMTQLGFSEFYGALYSPNYLCYKEKDEKTNETRLIIDINAPGNGFTFNNPKKYEVFSNGHKLILSFTGTKTLKEYDEFELGGGNMDSGNFRIDIYLDYDKYRINEEESRKKRKKGVMRFSYSLVEVEKGKKELKAVENKSSKKEKIKEKEKNIEIINDKK